MAKNTKGDGSLEQNGVTVVTPDNMGKGLVWNETTKQYDVSAKDSNGVKVNPDGSVGLALSPDAGNQIELRPNGIYLGDRPTQANFYVSLQGNDANDGSRNNPVQSLHRAYELIAEQPTKGWYNIFLKAGQTFHESPRSIWLDSGKNLNFFHYDDPYFGDLIRGNGLFVDCYKELSRPTIVCDTFRDGEFIRWGGLQVSITNHLNFYGVNTVINTTNGNVTGGAFRYYVNTMQHTGDITINGVLGLASASIINLCGNTFTLNGNIAPFINDYNPSIQQMYWVFPNQVHSLNGKTGTGRQDNIRQSLKPETAVVGTSFDRNTKTLFGFSTNWDCFK